MRDFLSPLKFVTQKPTFYDIYLEVMPIHIVESGTVL
jgi:hypothetical protein